MLSRYSVVDIEDALRSASPRPPFPTVQDRVAWDAIGHRLRDDRVARIVHPAEHDGTCPVPPLPATLYLDFLRTGSTPAVIRPGICSVTLRQLPVDEGVAVSAAAELACIDWGADIHVPPGNAQRALLEFVPGDDPALIPRRRGRWQGSSEWQCAAPSGSSRQCTADRARPSLHQPTAQR
jgi:hypothetical protein